MANPLQKVGLGESAVSSSQASGNFTNNTGAGNEIVVVIILWTGASDPQVSTVSDTVNTYERVATAYKANGNERFRAEIWWAKNIAGGTKTGVTVTLTSNADEFEVGAMECSGLNLVDKTNKNIGTATPSTPGSVTTSYAIEFVVDLKNSNNVITWATPTNYTNQFQDTGSTFEASQTNTRELTSTSTENPSSTTTGTTHWCACIATFFFTPPGRLLKPWNHPVGIIKPSPILRNNAMRCNA